MKSLVYLQKILAEQGGSFRPDAVKRVFLRFAVDEPRTDGKKLIQIFPLGEITTVDGEKFDFRREDLEAVAAALNAAEQELPAFVQHWDWESPVGWVTEFHVTDEGLFGWVRWIDQWVVDKIRAETLKYTSPGFFVDKDQRLMSVIEVSLTNTPRLQGMRPVEASIKPQQIITSPSAASTEKGKRMKRLRAALGLADDASDEDTEKAALEAIGEKKATQEQAAVGDARFAALEARLSRVEGERDAALQTEQAMVIERFVRDGQLTKAEADALGFESAQKLASLRAPGATTPTKKWFRPGKASVPAEEKKDLSHEEAVQMAVAQGKPLTQFLTEYYKEAN